MAESTLKHIVGEFPQLDYYSVSEFKWGAQKLILARTGYTGEDGFEIFGSHGVIGTLWEDLIKAGVTPCGLAARDVLRLEVGYPLYGHELNDEITPLDAALSWTVKMNKTNFVGKAALADYRPKFKTVKFVLEKGIPREGYPILNESGEAVGTVCSGTLSVVLNKGIAMARVQADKFSAQQNYFVGIRQNTYNAKYVTKAFVQGGHK
jgi:aminomethyltransferase